MHTPLSLFSLANRRQPFDASVNLHFQKRDSSNASVMLPLAGCHRCCRESQFALSASCTFGCASKRRLVRTNERKALLSHRNSLAHKTTPQGENEHRQAPFRAAPGANVACNV